MTKHFVIVGGSKGIGLSLVKQLSAMGHQLTVFSRSAESLVGMDNVTHIAWDVTTPFPEVDLPETIDGLAYCPGSLNLRSFRSLKPEVFQQDFEVNVIGAIRATQACLTGLKKSGAASVLFFSTVAVQQGMFAHASIAASKGAIEGLARTLAAELAPAIRVNCIAPALTETPMTERFFANEEKAQAMADKYALKRAGKPEDMAELGCFLLNDQSSWITGQVVGVDGGMSRLR